MDSSELWIVRHGATEWSTNGRHTSVTDLPLLPEGEVGAADLAPRLKGIGFAQVLTSPLARARTTAAIAGFPDAEVDEDLLEWRYGDLEGLTTPQIREMMPGWTIWAGPNPGGESAQQVGERVDRVIARVRAVEGRTLVFAHGHCLRALAARWLGLPASEGRLLKLDTSTLSCLGYERETPVVLRWNA